MMQIMVTMNLVQWMPGIVGIYANDANYGYFEPGTVDLMNCGFCKVYSVNLVQWKYYGDEPCIVDGDCHSSAKSLAQSISFKSKENNLDTTDKKERL